MTHTHDHPIRTMPLKSIARTHSLTQRDILPYQHPDRNISLTSLRPPNDPTIFTLFTIAQLSSFLKITLYNSTHDLLLLLLLGICSYQPCLLLNSCGKSPATCIFFMPTLELLNMPRFWRKKTLFGWLDLIYYYFITVNTKWYLPRFSSMCYLNFFLSHANWISSLFILAEVHPLIIVLV